MRAPRTPAASSVAPAASTRSTGAAHTLQRVAGNRAVGRVLSRTLELRAPNRGASAFDRRQEFTDRINQQTPGVWYELDEQHRLVYTVLTEALVERFDRKMMQYIDAANHVPMVLVPNSRLIEGQHLLVDSFILGFVDVDDMLGCSDLSFQLNLIHLLEERMAIDDYAGHMGRPMRGFRRAHRLGIVEETELLRAHVGDPTIEFVFEENQGNGRLVFGYRSRRNRYRIFHIFRRGRGGVQTGDVFARIDGQNRLIPIDEFVEQRRAAAAPVPAVP